MLKLALEDHAATACAVQNFMVSLASEGFGSKWMTGALAIAPDALMELVGAGEDERFMGIIFHLIIILAIGITALFYSHLELTLKRKFSKVCLYF